MRRVECVVCDRSVEDMTRRDKDIDGCVVLVGSENRMVLLMEMLLDDCVDNRNGFDDDEVRYCCRAVAEVTDGVMLWRGCCIIVLRMVVLALAAEADSRPPAMVSLLPLTP